MRLSFEYVQEQLERVLIEHGSPEDKAKKVSYEMARNSLEGTYSHGINRFAKLIKDIDNGLVKTDEEPVIVNGFGGIENYDGKLGLGITNAQFCMDRAIELAKEHGVGIVAIKNTNHWLRAATYGYQACDAGMAGICFTNTMPNMPTWGAVDSRIGNNPLVLAFPRKKGHMIVDMAMSQFSYGALEVARLENRQMSIDAGFDRDGNLTKDPDGVLKSGRILPTGYWKGAALSFMLDIFASTIAMGRSVVEIGKLEGGEHGVSQVFMAINYKEIVGEDVAEQIADNAVEDLLASEKGEHTDRIVYPGQRMHEYKADNLEHGIPVNERIWNKIMSL